VSRHDQGVLDTNVVAALHLFDPSDLPNKYLITAVSLGELSHAPHATDDPVKRASRMATLQHVETTFDPLPYDAEAARMFGRVSAAVMAAGRAVRGRVVDLMIAATAAANELPLYTANDADFKGLEDLLDVIAVRRLAGGRLPGGE
jgi:predicted nucleic acid-binding protein